MKTALVIGISGGFGSHVAQAMLNNGWHIKALMRDTTKLPKHLGKVDALHGDAANSDDVRKAAQNADVIVYGVNIPYPRWNKEALPLLENTVKVAEDLQQTIVFPGNVYIFNPDDGPVFSEKTAANPVVEKGLIRQKMEQRLKEATTKGAKVLILRAGDFIGAGAPSTWMQELIKPRKKSIKLSSAGPRDLNHSWAYLPDVAQTIAELLQNKEQLPAYSVFHFKGYQISFNEIANAIHTATGKPVTQTNFPWWLIRLVAPFFPMLRNLLEMRYLWNREVNLDEEKLCNTLGKPVPHTPLPVALEQAGLI